VREQRELLRLTAEALGMIRTAGTGDVNVGVEPIMAPVQRWLDSNGNCIVEFPAMEMPMLDCKSRHIR
jgi:hypothetical protein